MDFTAITIEILKQLSHITGSYGMAIVVITIIVKLIMWPLSVSQQRSMKKMQMLSPKLKEVQNRYKSNPQEMQKKMMEFYKEHNFNPVGGCFPLLIQMPVFIMLYSALMSPQFNEIASKSHFLFIQNLGANWRSHAGISGDNLFGVKKDDTFSAEKTAVVYVKGGKTEKVSIKNTHEIQPQGKITPGKPMDLKMKIDNLDLSFEKLNQVEKADLSVTNNATKELEHIQFKNDGHGLLTSTIKTEDVKDVYHFDVLVLIVLFALTMFFSQKVMTASSSTEGMDPAQKAMQEQMGKMMPIMLTGMFLFIPIPAGVLLYMVVSNIVQIVQTVIINRGLDKEFAATAGVTSGSVPADARKVTPKKSDDNN